MFEIYKDRASRWRWHFKANNRRIMGDSGQGYRTEAAARLAVERFQTLVADAPITVWRPRLRPMTPDRAYRTLLSERPR